MVLVPAAEMIEQYTNVDVRDDMEPNYVHWLKMEWSGFAMSTVTNYYTGATKQVGRVFEPCCIAGEPYTCIEPDYDQQSSTYGQVITKQRLGKSDGWQNWDFNTQGPYVGYESSCRDSLISSPGYRMKTMKRFINGEEGDWVQASTREIDSMGVHRDLGGSKYTIVGNKAVLEDGHPCQCGDIRIGAGLVYFGPAYSHFSGDLFYGIEM